MNAVITQPTYLPWLGYFDLIDQADIFVFLDTVQFEKQSWQQRNKIRTSKGLEWITVPALIKGRFGQLIKDVELNPIKFPDKHIKQIRQNYSQSPFFEAYYEEFSDILAKESEASSLCDVNIGIVKWLCSKLSLKIDFVRSSELKATGKRSELLVNILKEINADSYLSPLGSLDYIKNDYCIFEKNNVAVTFQNYTHPEYRQIYKPFMPYASIIDLLFNEGERGLKIIRSGRKESFQAKELIK